MIKKKFIPIMGDLSKLTEEQKHQYVLDACEHLQVPPELDLVSLSLMDTGDGARQLLLYVKRGATDIIRERLKISVEKLEPCNGDGYVGWTATGRDGSGRQEMAVGAVNVKGLSGTAVANAVKASQTQALRRMTLQFAGGGFLDVTELGEKTTDIVNSAQSLAQIAAQPSVKINTEAGKDVTQPQGEPVPLEAGSSLAGSSEEPKRRGRRKRNVVSLDSEGPIKAAVDSVKELVLTPADSKVFVGAIENPPEPSESTIKAVEQYLTQRVDKLPDNGTIPTPEEKKKYRDQLSIYVNDILPKAGLLQSEKLGSRNDQIKTFVKKKFPDADTKAMSVEQWDSLFLFFSNEIQQKGPEHLVKLIYSTIGEGK